jgi:pimeloyl-ACP methyl ester carboxylesterase
MLRCYTILIAFFSSFALMAWGQISTSSNTTPEKAASNRFDEEAYRKLDPTLTFFRERSAGEYAIDTAKGIDEEKFVSIGGIEQWVTIRGEDRNNPVLLFLHGGPGEATNMWSFPFFAPWEKQFTVVQWDQRGAGRTFGKSGPSIAPTVTLERMTRDGIELSEYLCNRLGKRKIILVAHSFGTLLGLRMVQQQPDLYVAYVGTGQVADETQNYRVAYQALLAEAEARGNSQAIQELKSVGQPPYNSSKGYQVQRRWSNRFEGADKFLPATLGLSLEAPGYSVQDLDDLLAGEIFSADQLVPQTRSATMKDLGLKFAVPMFFFQGTKDSSTPSVLARRYLELIQAPQKDFVPITGGHFAVFMNSEEFLNQLLTHVAPLAAKS